MGLDAWGFTVQTALIGDRLVDFEVAEGQSHTIANWRRHYLLQQWMGHRYRSKHGSDPEFNLVNLRLDAADLDELERCIDVWRKREGEQDDHDYDSVFESIDRDFVVAARRTLADGLAVYYRSWW